MMNYRFAASIVSVTRWLDYFFIFDHLQQEKVAQKHNSFAKEGKKSQTIRCQSITFNVSC